jgi:HEAT repeat protein
MVSAKSSSQPATDPPVTGLTTGTTIDGLTSDIAQARRRAIVAGRTGDRESATALLDHHEPAVRQAALGALAADGRPDTRLIVDALGDSAWTVRRRACELAGRLAISAGDEDRDGNPSGDDGSGATMNTGLGAVIDKLVVTLSDSEPLVAEAAAWALGELAPIARDGHADSRSLAPDSAAYNSLACTDGLADMATRHVDPLCREAAVAALGAIGEPSSLESVLSALGDKPPIRRRATIALAAFNDTRADDALKACLKDRDWQVRQAAEDLLGRMD